MNRSAARSAREALVWWPAPLRRSSRDSLKECVYENAWKRQIHLLMRSSEIGHVVAYKRYTERVILMLSNVCPLLGTPEISSLLCSYISLDEFSRLRVVDVKCLMICLLKLKGRDKDKTPHMMYVDHCLSMEDDDTSEETQEFQICRQYMV